MKIYRIRWTDCDIPQVSHVRGIDKADAEERFWASTVREFGDASGIRVLSVAHHRPAPRPRLTPPRP